MLPTHHELQGFIEIAKLGNISRAAQSLGISQPSLSQILKRLESRVGHPLFIRQRSGVHLTDAGRAILARTQEILGLWEQTINDTSWMTEELSGHIRIGCHVSVAQYALSPILRCIVEEYPRLRVSLIHDLSRRLVDRVLHHEAEIAVAINPFRSPELVLRSLAEDEIGFFAQSKIKTLKEAEDLWLFVDPQLIQTQTLLRQVHGKGHRFKGIIESSSLEVCANLVRDRVGIGILPARVQSLHAPDAKKIADAPVYKDEIKLVYRADYVASPALRTFVRRLEAVSKQMLFNK